MTRKRAVRSSLNGRLQKNDTVNIRRLKAEHADEADRGNHGILCILLLFVWLLFSLARCQTGSSAGRMAGAHRSSGFSMGSSSRALPSPPTSPDLDPFPPGDLLGTGCALPHTPSSTAQQTADLLEITHGSRSVAPVDASCRLYLESLLKETPLCEESHRTLCPLNKEFRSIPSIQYLPRQPDARQA